MHILYQRGNEVLIGFCVAFLQSVLVVLKQRLRGEPAQCLHQIKHLTAHFRFRHLLLRDKEIVEKLLGLRVEFGAGDARENVVHLLEEIRELTEERTQTSRRCASVHQIRFISAGELLVQRTLLFYCHGVPLRKRVNAQPFQCRFSCVEIVLLAVG